MWEELTFCSNIYIFYSTTSSLILGFRCLSSHRLTGLSISSCSCPLFCRAWLFSLCNCCNVDAGDQLISVNEVNLQGLSHATAIDVLQNAPDDVTLVVSQPKERLYKGESRNTSVAICNTFITGVFHCFSSLC